MTRSQRWAISVPALSMALALLPATLSAQSIWIDPASASGHVSVEWARPEFTDDEGLSFLTSTLFVSTRIAVSDELRIVGEIPFSYFDVSSDYPGDDLSDNAVGNPYVGLELGPNDGPAWAEVGVRIPVAPTNNVAVFSGLFADYDRCEAFMPEVLSISGIVNYRYEDRSGFGLRVRGGPLVWVDTDPSEYSDNAELLAVYSLQSVYDVAQLRLGIGVTGRMIASEKGLDLKERTVHQVGLAIVGRFRDVEPAVHVRLPIDEDLRDITDFGISLAFTVPLKAS